MDFPSNSQNPKPAPKDDGTEIEPKRILKVVDGTIVRKKRSIGSRFADVFGGADGRSVADYVMFEVLLPAFKDMVYEAFTSGLEQSLFRGNRPGSGRRPSSRGGASHTNYNSMSRPSGPGRRDDRDNNRPNPRRPREAFNFDEVILDSRRDAQAVIDRMIDVVAKYEAISVNDFYELIGEAADHTGEKWGWTDLDNGNAHVRPFRGGYVLDIPRPEPI